jgi:hypothetical protein
MIDFIKRIFGPYYKIEKVFTPNTIAQLTYIDRKTISDDLRKYINLPGKQIVVYGHSGSGKTTLLYNQLNKLNKKYIKVHCEKTTTFNDIILQTFDNLNTFYKDSYSMTESNKISKELKIDYSNISSNINSETNREKGESYSRIVPPQLTPQKLAKFLGATDNILVIEDFHKVSIEEKQRIADVIKIFIDMANEYEGVKIICIGAVGTARELIELDNNLHSRIAEVSVPLLSDDEIKEIINKGLGILNIKFKKDVVDKIAYYSNNLGAIAHQICYDICIYNNIEKMQLFSKEIKPNSFKNAVNSYVRKNSDTYNKIYDKILNIPYGWNILKKFDNVEKEYLSIEEIYNSIPQKDKNCSLEQIEGILKSMMNIDYDEIIRYDVYSKKYSISTPFFRAYLKMKLALEKSEIKERKKKKNKKKSRKYNIDDKNIFELENFEEYYQLLDSYMIKSIHIRSQSK